MSLEALTGLSAQLRALAGVGGEIAREALPGILEAATATAAAGTSPGGEAWAPKKDGSAALVGAAAAIKAEVSGVTEAIVTLVLPPPYVFHHLSKSKSLPRRQVLFDPADGVPEGMAAAIRCAAQSVVARTMGGR